jgi:hypothetical protein
MYKEETLQENIPDLYLLLGNNVRITDIWRICSSDSHRF